MLAIRCHDLSPTLKRKARTVAGQNEKKPGSKESGCDGKILCHATANSKQSQILAGVGLLTVVTLASLSQPNDPTLQFCILGRRNPLSLVLWTYFNSKVLQGSFHIRISS